MGTQNLFASRTKTKIIYEAEVMSEHLQNVQRYAYTHLDQKRKEHIIIDK